MKLRHGLLSRGPGIGATSRCFKLFHALRHDRQNRSDPPVVAAACGAPAARRARRPPRNDRTRASPGFCLRAGSPGRMPGPV